MGLWFWAGAWVLAVAGYLWTWRWLAGRIREHEQAREKERAMKAMKTTATTLALIMGLAIPASAEETEHQVVEISHGEVQGTTFHKLESRSGAEGVIRTDIVGKYLRVQLGQIEGDSLDPTTTSVDVSDPDITQAIVYLDGTVELVRAATAEAEPKPEPEHHDLVETYPQVDWESVFNRIAAMGPVLE